MKWLTRFMLAWPVVSLAVAIVAAVYGYREVATWAGIMLVIWIAATALHFATYRKI